MIQTERVVRHTADPDQDAVHRSDTWPFLNLRGRVGHVGIRNRHHPGQRRSGEAPEEPTERAALQIRASRDGITLSARGPVTVALALGAAAVVAADCYAGLAAWAIVLICAVQICAATAYSARRRA